MRTIPVFKPSFTDGEIAAVEAVLRSGWWGLGPVTKRFEEEFSDYINSPYAISFNSATSALHLALNILNVGGGEVITTPMTFVSTNIAIIYNNAKPVFVDIEPDTLNIDHNKIEERITKRTKAIMVVDYGGQPCDLDAIKHIAKKYKLPVVEDAAHACGSFYKNKPVGSISDLTCFSFHAVKNLAIGDGGMITLKNKRDAEKLKRLRWLGINKDTWTRTGKKKYNWQYDISEIGFKYHTNDILASIGLVQLKNLGKNNEKRRRIQQIYRESFRSIPWLECLAQKSYSISSSHNFVVKIKKSRDKFIDYLSDHNISASVHYYPNHFYKIFKPFRCKLPVAEKIWKEIVTLPLFPDMKQSELEYVIKTVKSFKKKI